jgi:hypothetical protein
MGMSDRLNKLKRKECKLTIDAILLQAEKKTLCIGLARKKDMSDIAC